MGFVYRVHHRDNPDQFVELEFEEKQTPIRVRDRACREYHYPWSAYTKLVVKLVPVDVLDQKVKGLSL